MWTIFWFITFWQGELSLSGQTRGSRQRKRDKWGRLSGGRVSIFGLWRLWTPAVQHLWTELLRLDRGSWPGAWLWLGLDETDKQLSRLLQSLLGGHPQSVQWRLWAGLHTTDLHAQLNFLSLMGELTCFNIVFDSMKMDYQCSNDKE